MVLIPATWFFTIQIRARAKTADVSMSREFKEESPPINQPLPDCRLKDINGQEFPVDQLRHGRVLIIYLTTNCDHCIKDAKLISNFQQDASSDLRIYGIAIERPAQVATFIKEFDLKFSILIDVNAQLVKSLDIHHFPSKHLVEDGLITRVWRGATRDEAELRRQLGIK